MLGVEFPICAFSHCRDVVAAVTNAGGFGILGAVAHSPERLHNELTWIEEQTGGKPYGVDLLLPPKVRRRRARRDRREPGLASCCPRSTARSSTTCWAATASRCRPTGRAQSRGGGLNISPKGYEPLLDVAFATTSG